MKVKIIAHTQEPEKIVASAAKLCYSNSSIENLMDNLNGEKIQSFLDTLTSFNHFSPLEHISFTFAIEDVSRSLMSQLTRHRIASPSVQSQRYVDMKDFVPVVPNDILKNEKANTAFNSCIERIKATYDYITNILENEYINNGVDSKIAHKQAIENARAILPNACPTKIIITMNARSLLNFFELRCCNRAQTEIRELANEMLRLVKEIAPSIFKNAGASCVRGKCKEGKMSCGHPQNK